VKNVKLCCAGTLGDAIKRQRGQRFSDSYIWKALLHVLLALHHVHSRKVSRCPACTRNLTRARILNYTQVLHRDIKAQNIFIAANGAIKIGDLGVAKLLGTRMQVRATLLPPASKIARVISAQLPSLRAQIPRDFLQFATTVVGTPYYLSPELCEGKPYNEKSDIWAIGVLL
jgi:NIMA (never in mitosis gene a)-related kinase